MKTEKIKKLNTPKIEKASKLVYFIITLIYKDHEKQVLPMVSKYNFVLKMIESSKETLKQDSNYVHKVYKETINVLLQPRVNIHELCVSVFKCICCSPNLDESNCKAATTIISEINLDYIENKITIAEHISVKFPGPYLQVKKSELSIPLVSRLGVLNSDEVSILFGTAFKMMKEKVSIKEFAYTHLTSFLAKRENNEVDITRIKKALDNLVFYEFITLPHTVSSNEDNKVGEGAIEISLCDLNKWNQGKRQGGGKIFDYI
jgi:hypothetical protein